MSGRFLKLVTVICISILLVSLFPLLSLGKERSEDPSKKIILVKEDIDVLEVDSHLLNLEPIEEYGEYTLVRTDQKGIGRLKEEGVAIDELQGRTEISVKGHTFDVFDERPDLDPDLMIHDYGRGQEGLYIVHMLGPVNPGWRRTLEEKGVDIINYVPNYAYEVKMTPEEAKRVEDLFFVDWVGIYQPGFKLTEDVEPGLVDVKLAEKAGRETLNKIRSKAEFLSITDLTEKRASLTAEVRTEKDLSELAHMNEVYHISNHAENKLHDEVATQIIGGGAWIWDPDDDPSTPYRGYSDHGALVNQLGWTGINETVAVADTGINPDHLDFQDRVIGGHDFSGNENWSDGHGHGTHVAGSVAGNTYNGTNKTLDSLGLEEIGPYYASQGLAYDSRLFSVKIFDSSENWIGPNDYFDVVQAAKQNSDSYIHSNSWGSDENLGEYRDSSEAFDEAVRDANRDSTENEPMVIVVAAGNQGSSYNTVGAPATGKNVIAVGSTENFMPDYGVNNPDVISSFSSRGWTEDNRIKPDVVAPGEVVYSTDDDVNDEYDVMQGTSQATPAVSGAASVVVEWYEEQFGKRPSPAMVRALLINTAHDLDDNNGNTGPIPNKDEGWGMVDLPSLIDSDSNFTFKDQDTSLTTGDIEEYTVDPENTSEPLKITLTWTDKEAQAGDNETLKNDLNLEVISPEGREYRGNAFEDGWTQANNQTMSDFDTSGDGWDDVNNVENVYIPADEMEMGSYTVRISGENVPSDANNDGTASQDFALAMYNTVEKPEGESPSIGVTRPTGGEVWDAETQEDILWNTTEGDDQISHVNLYYSVDGGENWKTISTELADTGEYTWNVPDEDSADSHVMVEVVDEAGRTNVSTSHNFTIEGKPPDPPEDLDVEHGGEHKNHNLISWDASPGDPGEVTHYNIYRAEMESDLGVEMLDSVDANGSTRYEYLDSGKGMDDETFWWYLVRAVDEDGLEETNDNAVQEPVRPFQVKIIGGDQRAVEGEQYTIEYNVTNIGQNESTQPINFSVDGEFHAQEEVTLEQGEVYTGKFVWIPKEVGNHSLEISSDDHSDSLKVEVFRGSNFELSSLKFDREMIEGVDLQVDYTVENTGDVEDTQDIDLKVVEFGNNGDIVFEEKDDIALQPDERYEGTFTWQTEEGDTGDYIINITTEDDTDSSLVSVYEEGNFAVDINSGRNFYMSKNIEVDYTVFNTKDNPDTQNIEFTVFENGVTEIHSDVETEVTISSEKSYEGKFVWDADEPGYYEVRVASEDQNETQRISVWKSGSFSVIAQVRGRSKDGIVTEGERVRIEYTVRNTKDEIDSQDIEIYIDDESLKVVEEVTLESGGEYSDEFSWEATSPLGERMISIRSEDDSTQISLEVFEGPNLEVQIDRPEEGQTFEAGEEIIVEFTVTNTGDLESEQNISIFIDGDKVEEISLKLQPDDSETQEYTFYAEEDKNNHQIRVATRDDHDTVDIDIGSDEGDLDIPGFTILYLLSGILLAFIIYWKVIKKKQ
ncbi:MAG: S8 family serine peptidase [Thermoplasmata archaeon]